MSVSDVTSPAPVTSRRKVRVVKTKADHKKDDGLADTEEGLDDADDESEEAQVTLNLPPEAVASSSKNISTVSSSKNNSLILSSSNISFIFKFFKFFKHFIFFFRNPKSGQRKNFAFFKLTARLIPATKTLMTTLMMMTTTMMMMTTMILILMVRRMTREWRRNHLAVKMTFQMKMPATCLILRM